MEKDLKLTFVMHQWINLSKTKAENIPGKFAWVVGVRRQVGHAIDLMPELAMASLLLL